MNIHLNTELRFFFKNDERDFSSREIAFGTSDTECKIRTAANRIV